MIRTVFAMAVAALVFAAVSGTSQAAPIAPLPGVTSADNGTCDAGAMVAPSALLAWAVWPSALRLVMSADADSISLR